MSTLERLAALRREIRQRDLDGFLVPRADEYQGEYVPPCSERLRWLTGFSGSAGFAVVLADQAVLFVDGRYTLQARQEADPALFSFQSLVELPPDRWLAANLPAGAALGYDPWLHTPDGVRRLRDACRQAGGRLVACDDNPLDALWTDRPLPPLAPVVPHPERFAGADSAEKRKIVASALAAARVDAVVLSAPDSIAWLLNLRGGDVPYAPLPLCFAVFHVSGPEGDGPWLELFVDSRKVSADTERHLGSRVSCQSPSELGTALEALGRARRRVRLDAQGTSQWIFERLRVAGAVLDCGADPCALPKACKNPVELDGARAAHRRDGVAMCRFLAWLAWATRSGTVTEIGAADRLEQFRQEGDLFRGLSFPTISAAGPDGAIVHYRALPETDRPLVSGSLYLVDSGAQYLDGTTDVTRTVAIGTLTREHRHRFTLVLKGHIAIATTIFPAGTTGSQLDALARHALWQEGLDYDHGTGHGVGSYLSVHEGPHRISPVGNSIALKPGMIVSNEPGYYKAGAFGIRIESLLAVVEPPPPAGAERQMLGFETLTLVPIDRALVEPELLTAAERAWFDAYHRRVRESLAPHLPADAAAWLEQATAPL
ncbi:MAG: aminopeptidase P family protein [Alphaproteobacteria bacterium]